MINSMGVDLINQLNDGTLGRKHSQVAIEVKAKVTDAMTELVRVGARVRPLLIKDKRVGWMRPLSFSERKILESQYDNEDDRIRLSIWYCTTLTNEEISDLDLVELNSLLRVMVEANLADLSLFPFISAFTSTQSSINLWSSKHDRIFDKDTIDLPDGSQLRLLCPSDHIQLWSTLCVYRDRAISKLEQAINFSALVKTMAGKNADRYIKDLIKSLNAFEADPIDPWEDIINFSALDKDIDFNDGFGHAHQDGSTTGLLREMEGMMTGDRHEQAIQSFYDSQIAEAKRKEEEVQRIIQNRREQLANMEVDDTMVVMTEREVRARETQLRRESGIDQLLQGSRDALLAQDDEYHPGR